MANERNINKVSDSSVANKYQQLKHSAKDRGIKFDLTLMSVRNLLQAKRCYYTGEEFTDKGFSKMTVDRVDPSEGYVVGNVRACTHRFNQLKQTFEHASCKDRESMLKAINKAVKAMKES